MEDPRLGSAPCIFCYSCGLNSVTAEHFNLKDLTLYNKTTLTMGQYVIPCVPVGQNHNFKSVLCQLLNVPESVEVRQVYENKRAMALETRELS